MKNNNFVYIWKESGIAGLPFYVGQGAHRKGDTDRCKYQRMYCKHRPHVQWKWDSLDEPVAVLHSDNLTKSEADALEMLLIARLGRVNNGTGILLNITAGGNSNSVDELSVRNKLRKTTSDNWKSADFRNRVTDRIKESWTDDRKTTASITGSNRWSDEEYKTSITAKMTAQRNTPIGKKQQAERASSPITYCGVYYPSRNKLAEAFGLSVCTVRKRLNAGIPLDTQKGIGRTGRPRKQHE